MVYTKSLLQSLTQEIIGIPMRHTEMRTGSSVMLSIYRLYIEIKFSGIYFWNARVYPHYKTKTRTKTQTCHPCLCLLISLQQDEAFHGHHFLLPDPGRQQPEMGYIRQGSWSR